VTLRVAVACVALLATMAPARAQEATLRDILDRTAQYIVELVTDFANVVAREDMRQEYRAGPRRTLRSDFLLVKTPGEERRWLAFRDVTAVNGRAVSDQQDRLAKLFLEPFEDALRRATEISRDASRHSLVALGLENNPFAVVAMLQPFYYDDYMYDLGGRSTEDGVVVRVVEIEGRPPVQRNPAILVQRVSGKAWVEESTGRIRRTELRIGRAPNTQLNFTRFQFDQALRIDVPVEMKESRASGFEMTATYSNFRRFQVRTEEALDPATVGPTR
jgi:hypothetical protein